MKKLKKLLCVFLSVLLCAMSMGIAASAVEVGDSGSFRIINYNIAGLPIPSSMAGDNRNALDDNVLMGQMLNNMGFDIIAVQEDFNYDLFFRAELKNYANVLDDQNLVTERHATDHSNGVPSGDGLNIFTKSPMYNTKRFEWNVTAGASIDQGDELTPKGFQVVTIALEEGYYLDIYNLHADAFGDQASVAAKKSQFNQIAQYIMKHSVYDEETMTYDHAVIVTGDFNASLCWQDNPMSEDGLLTNLLIAAHLNDAWAVCTIDSIGEDAGDYSAYYTYANETDAFQGYWGHYDSVERFCYADGNGIDLTCDSFSYVDFKDSTGRSLSDHSSAQSTFSYEIVDKVQDISNNHDNEETDQDQFFLLKFLNYIANLFKTLGKLIQEYHNSIFGK